MVFCLLSIIHGKGKKKRKTVDTEEIKHITFTQKQTVIL